MQQKLYMAYKALTIYYLAHYKKVCWLLVSFQVNIPKVDIIITLSRMTIKTLINKEWTLLKKQA